VYDFLIRDVLLARGKPEAPGVRQKGRTVEVEDEGRTG
jgi:hypothetical protein